MTTGDKILNLRKGKNITQEQLADMLGVSRQSVSKWESNIAYPEIDKLIRMSEIFNVSTDYLLKDKQESNQETLSKNRISNFTTATLIIAIIVIFGYIAGILLSYQLKKMEIGFLIYIPFIFAGLISYIIVRSKFYTKSMYSNEDQEAMFKNTRMIYYTIIFTFITILPRFFITIPYEIDIPFYDTLHIEGTLSLTGYVIFAFIYALIAFIISWVVSIFHKHYVYKVNIKPTVIYIIINCVFSIYVIGLAASILAKSRLSHNTLIPLALVIAIVYLLIIPTIYAILKKLSIKVYVIYLVLLAIVGASLITLSLLYLTLLLLIFAIVQLVKAYKHNNNELTFLYKNMIIVIISSVINAIPFLSYGDLILYNVIALIVTAIALFVTGVMYHRLDNKIAI